MRRRVTLARTQARVHLTVPVIDGNESAIMLTSFAPPMNAASLVQKVRGRRWGAGNIFRNSYLAAGETGLLSKLGHHRWSFGQTQSWIYGNYARRGA